MVLAARVSATVHRLDPVSIRNSSSLKRVLPGDTVVLANGEYRDVILVINHGGSRGRPVTYRAEAPGDVVFTGKSHVIVDAPHVVLDGLFFKDHTPQEQKSTLVNGQPLHETVVQINRSHVRVTGVRFLRNAGMPGGYQFLMVIPNRERGFLPRFVRIDHCAFESLGEPETTNWLRGDGMVTLGGREPLVPPGTREDESWGGLDFTEENLRDEQFLRNITTPSYVRFDHNHVDVPAMTRMLRQKFIVSHACLTTVDIPLIAGELGVPLTDVPEPFRRTIKLRDGFIVDNNFFKCYPWSNLTYSKSGANVWYGNTIVNASLGNWKQGEFCVMNNHFLADREQPVSISLDFADRNNLIVGNYIQKIGRSEQAKNVSKKDVRRDTGAFVLRSGFKAYPDRKWFGSEEVLHESVIAHNTIEILGDNPASAFSFDLTHQRLKEGFQYGGKQQPFFLVYATNSLNSTAYNNLFAHNIVYREQPQEQSVLMDRTYADGLQNNRWQDNLCTAGIEAGFLYERLLEFWPAVKSFRRDYAQLVAKEKSATPLEYSAGGFTPRPATDFVRDAHGLIRLKEEKPGSRELDVPNHPVLPYSIKALMQGRLELLPRDACCPRVEEADFRDFLNSLNRPLTRDDVGPQWGR